MQIEEGGCENSRELAALLPRRRDSSMNSSSVGRAWTESWSGALTVEVATVCCDIMKASKDWESHDGQSFLPPATQEPQEARGGQASHYFAAWP